MTPTKARAAALAASATATTPPGPRRRVAGARRRSGADTVIELPDTEHPETGPETHTGLSGPQTDQDDERPSRPEILSSADAPAGIAPDDLDDPADDPTSRDRPRQRRTPAVIPTVLSLCLVAVLAACLLAALTTRHDRADVAAGDAVVAAARTSTATILSYDYRHLDSDFAAATALTTGSFRSDYEATTTKAVNQLATQTKAVVVAKVAAAGVVSSTTDHATVLLFVDQTTTSNRLSAAKTDQVRVQVTMSRVGGRWLVSALKAL